MLLFYHETTHQGGGVTLAAHQLSNIPGQPLRFLRLEDGCGKTSRETIQTLLSAMLGMGPGGNGSKIGRFRGAIKAFVRGMGWVGSMVDET